MKQREGIARAHTNIALIKYWGKRDEALFLPMNSSLSLTLDAFYTDTRVVFDEALTADRFVLNQRVQGEVETAKISKFLNLFRQDMADPCFAKVESLNFVPTAAGLASSASAFAALASAANIASGLMMGRRTLSTYARQGSGSATRSIYGGFVEWEMGHSSASSQAVPVDAADWDLAMVVIAVSKAEKAVSSREGMALTVATSPFYPVWVETAAQDLADIKVAIADQDFDAVGRIAEHNGMKMHATTLAANPPFTYFSPDSLRAQVAVREIRVNQGLSGYLTMDAGPNVKVLVRASQLPDWMAALGQYFSADQLIASLPGPGAYSLSRADWSASQAKFLEGLKSS